MRDRNFLIGVVFLALLSGVFGGFLSMNFRNSLFFGDGVKVLEEDLIQQKSYVEESALIGTIQKAMPAVVSIQIFEDYASKSFLGSLKVSDFTHEEIGGGTGFIVSHDGLILTNRHLIVGAGKSYVVVMYDGKEYPAKFISEDPFDDVAVLRIDVSEGEVLDLPVVELGDSDKLKVGQRVIAIGNALALYGNTVTAGIISAKGREVYAFDDFSQNVENLSGLIQTDAAINVGNSGGPLIDLSGRIVGMNVAVAQSANNIGFAIPINDLKPVIKSIGKYGEIIRPVLGVRFVMLNQQQAKSLNLGIDHGAILLGGESLQEAGVIKGGAADLAGLKEGDVILQVNDLQVDSDNPLHKIIREFNPGDAIKVKFLRGSDQKEASVVLQSSKK